MPIECALAKFIAPNPAILSSLVCLCSKNKLNKKVSPYVVKKHATDLKEKEKLCHQ